MDKESQALEQIMGSGRQKASPKEAKAAASKKASSNEVSRNQAAPNEAPAEPPSSRDTPTSSSKEEPASAGDGMSEKKSMSAFVMESSRRQKAEDRLIQTNHKLPIYLVDAMDVIAQRQGVSRSAFVRHALTIACREASEALGIDLSEHNIE